MIVDTARDENAAWICEGLQACGQIDAVAEKITRAMGQRVSLRFDRERLWYEFFRADFNEADLQKVIRCLQREIRESRRNVGALKLSNLLQLDRFEEDLNISRVCLGPPPPRSSPVPVGPTCSPAEQQQGRQRALQQLRELQAKLRQAERDWQRDKARLMREKG